MTLKNLKTLIRMQLNVLSVSMLILAGSGRFYPAATGSMQSVSTNGCKNKTRVLSVGQSSDV
jgi:hypothetical protein